MLKAVELSDEPDATLYDHLGDIYSALQEPAKAQEAWKKAFSIEPAIYQKKLSPASLTTDRAMIYRYEKHYTRDEARALLPQVRQWLKRVHDLRDQFGKQDSRIRSLLAAGMTSAENR